MNYAKIPEQLYLTIDTLLDVVVLPFVGWYLFSVVSGNRYLPRGSNVNTHFFIASIGNVFVVRLYCHWYLILLLEFVIFTQRNTRQMKTDVMLNLPVVIISRYQ